MARAACCALCVAVACSTGTPCARGHVRACLQPLDRHHVGDGHFRPARVSAASRMQHCGRCTAEGCAALRCAAEYCIRCIQVVAHCIWTVAFAACGGCVAAQPQVALRVASVCSMSQRCVARHIAPCAAVARSCSSASSSAGGAGVRVRSASMIWRAPLNESVAAVRARSGRGRRFMPQRAPWKSVVAV